jgi:hypothetical protein
MDRSVKGKFLGKLRPERALSLRNETGEYRQFCQVSEVLTNCEDEMDKSLNGAM